MYNSCEIAERIKLTAKQNGKSVNEMLVACGLGKNTVAKLSNDTDILTLNFVKIADYLECPVGYLLGHPDEEPAKGFSPARLREAMGNMSCEEFAQKFDGSAKAISLYLDGKRKPSKVTVFFIATCLGVTPDWLEGLDVPKYKEPVPEDGDGLTENQRYLINAVLSMPDDDVRKLRLIVEEVISPREQ